MQESREKARIYGCQVSQSPDGGGRRDGSSASETGKGRARHQNRNYARRSEPLPDAKEATRFAENVEPFDIYFLEAPLQCGNLEGYARLSAASKVKIAAGEEQTTRQQMIDLMDIGKVDVIQPDPIWVGGLTECKRMVELARQRGVLFVPHCDKSTLNFVANLHLCAAVPNAPYAECPVSTPRLYT